ncbi:adenylate/guanylate cyclase domain-containing protein [Brucella lupini]|uniref:Adenylate and Guanylate cyclase catalytic domain protein n=1 Tax=Brucella lupini TaxID=255457 RepID=A0A256GYZ7_9HYPH|nr:adenylate/guanylate cyclase domain-containing protein [Brucella lupini]KAB2703275.1 adenylate/guanylate cyclase domain-containing protein [Brucella lupini]OYR32393.1 adenylate and Guanylate cyclase catalytic domain protein [Brucella lupini]
MGTAFKRKSKPKNDLGQGGSIATPSLLDVHQTAAESALDDAERKGFRLAVIGRTCALIAFAGFYLALYAYPNNVYVAGAIVLIAALGLIPLWLIQSRYERVARFVLFTFDAATASAILAFAPLSSGGDVPQNLVFLSSRTDYYYVILATSILTLSPALVIWTGFCIVIGLAGATVSIISGMSDIVSLGNLPASPSREEVLAVLLNPNFFAIPVRLNEGVALGLVTGVAALAVHRARNVVRANAATEAERARIQRIFGHYVPPQVAEQLIHAGQLAPQQRTASILFADIEGFTRLSETVSPSNLVEMLNDFFGAATAIVDAHGGVVVNYIGDALIASFNAPVPAEDHPARAIAVARDLLSLVSEREFEGHKLRLRIGVATGPVAAGTVGGQARHTYTLYGDTVNVAQRLEELNKEFNTDCLISSSTFECARSVCVDAIKVGAVQVRGRENAVEVYSLGEQKDTPHNKLIGTLGEQDQSSR